MRIAIIGAGRMGTALGGLVAQAGHEVVLSNSRGPGTLTDVVAQVGERCTAADVVDAVDGADVVVLATPWGRTQEAVSVVDDWTDRVVVDTTNNRSAPGPAGLIDIGDRASSEIVASYVPGARVVKAFNINPISLMAAALGRFAGENNAVFVSGDDVDAKEEVGKLIASVGGEAVDTGDLHTGGRLQATGGPLCSSLEMQTPARAREMLRDAQQS